MFTIGLGKSRVCISFHGIIVILYFAYCSIPALQFQIDARGNYIILGLILLYIIYWGFVKHYIEQKAIIGLSLISVITGVMYAVLTAHLHTPHPILSYAIIYAKMLVPLASFVILMEHHNREEQLFVVCGCSIILVYLIYQTIVNNAANNDLVHQISNMSYENFDNSLIALSMDQSYALVPVACLVFSCILKERNILLKIVAAALLTILVATLFVAQFTTAVLILLICMAMFLLKSGRGVSKFLIVVLLALLIIFLPSILLYIAENVESENMNVRLTEVAIFLKTGDASGYNMNGRLTLYTKGIIAFLKSPLIGNYYLGFNPHSSFIQFAADIGIIGLLSFVYTLRYAKKIIVYFLDTEALPFTIAYLALVLTGMINPITAFPTMFFVVFCYVPLCIAIQRGECDLNEELEY